MHILKRAVYYNFFIIWNFNTSNCWRSRIDYHFTYVLFIITLLLDNEPLFIVMSLLFVNPEFVGIPVVGIAVVVPVVGSCKK